MPAFCTKCGQPMAEGAQFCTSCGNTAAAPQAATSSPPPPPQPAPQRSSIPPPPPRTSAAGTGMPTFVKVMLGLLAVLLVVGLLAMAAISYFAVRFARNVEMDSSSGRVTVRTPEGKITVGKVDTVTEAELGIPIYPGAQPAEEGFEMTGERGGVRIHAFTTDDPVAKVADFYKEKLGDVAETSARSADGAVMTLNNYKGSDYIITIARDGRRTQIGITVAQRREPI